MAGRSEPFQAKARLRAIESRAKARPSPSFFKNALHIVMYPAGRNLFKPRPACQLCSRLPIRRTGSLLRGVLPCQDINFGQMTQAVKPNHTTADIAFAGHSAPSDSKPWGQTTNWVRVWLWGCKLPGRRPGSLLQSELHPSRRILQAKPFYGKNLTPRPATCAHLGRAPLTKRPNKIHKTTVLALELLTCKVKTITKNCFELEPLTGRPKAL